MSVIFYGLCGEGLGHAARALALIERLPEHEVHVFTSGDAYDFFLRLGYRHLHQFHGMFFAKDRYGGIDFFSTAKAFLEFAGQPLRDNIAQVHDWARYLDPALCITDWEPSLPRAARARGLPCLSIDNQHKFRFCSGRGLPTKVQLYAFGVGWFARWVVPLADHWVVSTFQCDVLKKDRRDVTLTQCIVRRECERLRPTNDGFLLVYAKHLLGERILQSLAGIDRDIVVYGAARKVIEGPRVSYRPLSYPDFIIDLARCDAVFCTAGNQLLGEARYFCKRSFVVPIPKQHEQLVNALSVNQMGLGVHCPAHRLTPKAVEKFLKEFQTSLSATPNGAVQATEVIRRKLALAGRRHAVAGAYGF